MPSCCARCAAPPQPAYRLAARIYRRDHGRQVLVVGGRMLDVDLLVFRCMADRCGGECQARSAGWAGGGGMGQACQSPGGRAASPRQALPPAHQQVVVVELCKLLRRQWRGGVQEEPEQRLAASHRRLERRAAGRRQGPCCCRRDGGAEGRCPGTGPACGRPEPAQWRGGDGRQRCQRRPPKHPMQYHCVVRSNCVPQQLGGDFRLFQLALVQLSFRVVPSIAVCNCIHSRAYNIKPGYRSGCTVPKSSI